MLILNRAGQRTQSCGIILNTLKAGLNILITSSRESFSTPHVTDSKTYIFSHLNISKIRIVPHNYCQQGSGQWCSFIASPCVKNKINNMKAYRMDGSCLVENAEDNSGGLFHNYCITNSLDVTEYNIIWKNTVSDDIDSEESECEDILEITTEFISFTCFF